MRYFTANVNPLPAEILFLSLLCKSLPSEKEGALNNGEIIIQKYTMYCINPLHRHAMISYQIFKKYYSSYVFEKKIISEITGDVYEGSFALIVLWSKNNHLDIDICMIIRNSGIYICKLYVHYESEWC